MQNNLQNPGRNKYSSKGSVSNYTDMVISEYELNLSFAQQIQIQKFVEKKNIRSFLVDVVHKVHKNERLDERSKEYKHCQSYMGKVKRESFHYAFTNEQLEFIDKNYQKMREKEITKLLFPKMHIKKLPLSKEHKAMMRYIKAIKIKNIKGSLKGKAIIEAMEDPTQFDITMDFVPPKTLDDLCYCINNADTNAKYDSKKLTKEQRENVEALKGYLNATRFMVLIDSAPNNLYKKVMMSEYVKAVYDKKDLTSDELNQYITLCDLYGIELEAKKQINLLNEQIELAVDDDDPKVKISIVEALTSKTQELDKIHVRQSAIQKSLSGDRTKRLEKQVELGQSLILFVNKWKEEEYRLQSLKIAESRKIKLKEEKKRMESFDDMIAEFIGIQEEEILNI